MPGYVVCIGKNCIDEYYQMESYPALGDKVLLEYTGAIPGGFMANAATVAGALGADCYMMDVLGDDAYTDVLMDTMKKNNVKTDLIEFVKGVPNGKTMILMVGDEKTVLLFKGKHKIPTIDERSLGLLRGASFVYSNIGDLSKFDNPRALIEDFTSHGADLFIDAETSTFHDRVSQEFFFQKARIISLNEFAVEKYCGDKGEAAFFELIGDDPRKIIVETLGSKGCRILTKDRAIDIPAYRIDPVDTTGAGDTFNGGLLYGLLQGWDIEEAGKFASAAAARSVLFKGARSGAVPAEEVFRFMKNGGRV